MRWRSMGTICLGFGLLSGASIALAQSGAAVAEVDRRAGVRAQQEYERLGSGIGDAKLQALVEATYGRVELYTGRALTFDLADFATYDRSELQAIAVSALVDLAPQRSIELDRGSRTRTTRREGWSEEVKIVVYEPRWIDAARPAVDDRISLNEAFAEVLVRAAAAQPQLLEVEAVTSFTVTAHLQDESLSYRAAIAWTPEAAPDRLRFFVADPVIERVEDVVREIVPPPLAEDERRAEGDRGLALVRPIAKSGDSVICEPRRTSFSTSQQRSGFNDHYRGSHDSRASFEIVCECTSDCRQTCRSGIPQRVCGESPGAIPQNYPLHQLASSYLVETSTSSDGHASPAACAAGAGCVQKSCDFPLFCNVGVSVGSSGPSVSFGNSGGPDWEGNLSFGRTCPPCSVIPQDEPIDDGGDEGGGGPPGGGGGDGPAPCSCDCDGDGWVGVNECLIECGGTVNGDYCDV